MLQRLLLPKYTAKATQGAAMMLRPTARLGWKGVSSNKLPYLTAAAPAETYSWMDHPV